MTVIKYKAGKKRKGERKKKPLTQKTFKKAPSIVRWEQSRIKAASLLITLGMFCPVNLSFVARNRWPILLSKI